MKTIPHKAFVLAAGYGKRLRPYTDDTPKPLVKVTGTTLLDRTLDHLKKADVREIAINSHYLADQIKAFAQTRDDFKIHLSHEQELLDTGGGIKNMLHIFDDAFFVLSGDSLWSDAPQTPHTTPHTTLQKLANAWNPDTMDILLLLQPVDTMTTTKAVGDYDLDKDGKPVRSLDKTGQYMFTSIRINHPRIFEGTPNGAFSYLDLMDKAEQNGRLHALVHDGQWHHISTPQDLESVENYIQQKTKADDAA